jgi:hypothetical protein
VRSDARTVAQWLIPLGISLNTFALFLSRAGDDGPHGWLAVLKAVLQLAAVACFVVAFVRLWRARRRRLQSVTENDLDTESPSP